MGYIEFRKSRLRTRKVGGFIAFDEDTAVGDAIVDCGRMLHHAAEAVKNFCRAVPCGWPDEGKESVDLDEAEYILGVAIDAERCGAYLKGVLNALGADVSREYAEHLIDVANAIGRARKGGFRQVFASDIPTCIEPNDIRHFGGVKSVEECIKNGCSPIPAACKDGNA